MTTLLARGIIARQAGKQSILKGNSCTGRKFSVTNQASKRPTGVRMGWSRNVISELLPFTSELISVRGRPLENIAVAYCVSSPVMDVKDPKEGEVKTQRNVEDSWLEMILPFSDQLLLRDSMVRSDGCTIRFGKLFEILDALAADVAYRHCGAGEELVTYLYTYLSAPVCDGMQLSVSMISTIASYSLDLERFFYQKRSCC